MNTSIIGCKYFNDYQVLKWHLDGMKITQITTCGNDEIDKMTARYANENNIKLIVLWPQEDIGWFGLNKEYFKLVDSCNVLVTFWFGYSPSVTSMIKRAKRKEKEVIIIRGYHPDPDKASNLKSPIKYENSLKNQLPDQSRNQTDAFHQNESSPYNVPNKVLVR